MTKTKKAGRPRLDSSTAGDGGLRKGKSITFTPAEWRLVERLARRFGLRPTDYVRKAALRVRMRARNNSE